MPSTRSSTHRTLTLQRTIKIADALIHQFEELNINQLKIVKKGMEGSNIEVVYTYNTKFYTSSALTIQLFQECVKLFERNMTEFYLHSSWGLDLESKRKELSHVKARYLIVTEENGVENNEIVAFAHFRFDLNCYEFPTEAVLYIYEIQVRKENSGCGIGKRLVFIFLIVQNPSSKIKIIHV